MKLDETIQILENFNGLRRRVKKIILVKSININEIQTICNPSEKNSMKDQF